MSMLYEANQRALTGELDGLVAVHETVCYELVRRVMEARSPRYATDRPQIVEEIRRLCGELGRFDLRPEGLNRHFVLRKLEQIVEIANAPPTDQEVLGPVKELQDRLHTKGWRKFPPNIRR